MSQGARTLVVIIGAVLTLPAGAAGQGALPPARAHADGGSGDLRAGGQAARRRAPSCKRLAGRQPAARAGGVYVFQKSNGLFYVCSRTGKVRALPGQGDGPEDSLGGFVINGSWLTYTNTLLVDPVAPTDDYVYVVNVKTGKRLVNGVISWPGPGSDLDNSGSGVSAIVLAPDGSVAWLAGLSPAGGGPVSALAVVRIQAGGTQSTLAQGPDLTGLSASGNGATVSWTQNGAPASAPLA